ncbi:hypothetical protein NL676_003003 [Syzygium grande]|nr:hypothetical protein NL676_003003 [Syzygium grande]
MPSKVRSIPNALPCRDPWASLVWRYEWAGRPSPAPVLPGSHRIWQQYEGNQGPRTGRGRGHALRRCFAILERREMELRNELNGFEVRK